VQKVTSGLLITVIEIENFQLNLIYTSNENKVISRNINLYKLKLYVNNEIITEIGTITVLHHMMLSSFFNDFRQMEYKCR